MKIAICDDCYEDALTLNDFLEGQETKIYSSSDSLMEDVEHRGQQYDLYLLDIFMGDTTDGLELARKLRIRDREAAICFISSSDGFYREAYDLYAVQYLLKPVREKDVEALLDRVSHNISRNKDQSLRFKFRGQAGAIAYGNILYISSREHTLLIQCRDGTVQRCMGKLSEMEQQVDGNIFQRCHQSFLVNMYQVDSLNGSDLMVAGYSIPISRRYYPEVRRRYREILFEEVE